MLSISTSTCHFPVIVVLFHNRFSVSAALLFCYRHVPIGFVAECVEFGRFSTIMSLNLTTISLSVGIFCELFRKTSCPHSSGFCCLFLLIWDIWWIIFFQCSGEWTNLTSERDKMTDSISSSRSCILTSLRLSN